MRLPVYPQAGSLGPFYGGCLHETAPLFTNGQSWPILGWLSSRDCQSTHKRAVLTHFTVPVFMRLLVYPQTASLGLFRGGCLHVTARLPPNGQARLPTNGQAWSILRRISSRDCPFGHKRAVLVHCAVDLFTRLLVSAQTNCSSLTLFSQYPTSRSQLVASPTHQMLTWQF